MSDDAGESGGWARLAERLDELTRELRRQGRAAVAAQAASESCLEQLAALERMVRTEREDAEEGENAHGFDKEDGRARARETELRVRESAAWLEVLIPVADAIDRTVSQASEIAERVHRRPRLRLWPFTRKPAVAAEQDALASGMRVLRDQLTAALESRGVRVERRVDVDVDPELHRVVAVRPPSAGRPEREGTVLEVIRPGYALGQRIVREADVVAAGGAVGDNAPQRRTKSSS